MYYFNFIQRNIYLLFFALLASCVSTTKTNLEVNPGSATFAEDLPSELVKGYQQANLLNLNNNRAGALNLLNELQLKFPKFSGPSYRMARIYLEQKEYKTALKYINQSLTISPSNYYADNLQGIIYRKLGQFDASKKSYQKSIVSNGSFPNSHLNLAILADIYLYDLSLALQQYEIYLALTNESNKRVKGWVIDLKRRIARGKK